MIESVLNTTGGNNDAGLKRTVYFALASDVLTWPTKEAAPTTYEDLVLATGAFAMKSTKRFWEFEADVRKNKITSESAGERGSKSAINKLEVVRSRISASVLGFLEQHKNDELVFIVEELNGELRVLGAEDLPATIESFTINGGADVSDDRNVSFTAEAVGRLPMVYTGQTIPLTPAV
jgi:hypothetical protein